MHKKSAESSRCYCRADEFDPVGPDIASKTGGNLRQFIERIDAIGAGIAGFVGAEEDHLAARVLHALDEEVGQPQASQARFTGTMTAVFLQRSGM